MLPHRLICFYASFNIAAIYILQCIKEVFFYCLVLFDRLDLGGKELPVVRLKKRPVCNLRSALHE